MSAQKTVHLYSLLLISVMILSWVLNFGLTRLKLSFVFFPAFMSLIFYYTNSAAAKRFQKSKALKVLTIVSCVTFLLPHLLVEDTDGEAVFAFFGLVRDEGLAGIMTTAGYVFFAIEIAATAAQLVLIYILKNREDNEALSDGQ